MKLVVDMNLSPNWVAEFRSRGVESIHWSGLGLRLSERQPMVSE